MRYFIFSIISIILLLVSIPCRADSSWGLPTWSLPQIPLASYHDKNASDDAWLIRSQNRSYGKYAKSLRGYGLWGSLYGYDGRLRPKNSVFDKISHSDLGMQIGIDIPCDGIFGMSFYYSLATPTLSIQRSPNPFLIDGKLETTNHLFGLRWSSYRDGLYLLFGMNGGFDDHDFATTGSGIFSGSGWQMGTNGEVGLDVELGKWRLRPHLGLDYRWLNHGAIENNQSALFRGETHNALYSNFGTRLYRPINPLLDWQTRLSWLHNYLKDDPIYGQRFNSIPGLATPTMLFLNGSPGRDWIWLGTGLKLHFGKLFSCYLDYDLTFNKYEATHAGSFMAILAW